MVPTGKRVIALLLTGLAVGACGEGTDEDATLDAVQQDEEWGGLDFPAISALIVERTALDPGERVLLVGQPGRWDPLIPLIQRDVAAAGGVDLGAVDVFGAPLAAGEPTPFADSLGAAEPAGLTGPLSTVDLAIMLPGATPTEATTDVYRAMQDVLRGGNGRTIHFHWAGATGFDGEVLAEDDEVDRLYQRALLETDYDALARAQQVFEDALRSGTVHVSTPDGTDLTFRVEDRPVTRQDGDASADRAEAGRTLIDREVELPAGAVRVSPVLETVEGTIAFPPADWGGARVEGLRLRFEGGVVVEATADTGLEGFEREADAAGPAGRTFRELAVGFNPVLTIPAEDPWIPYYGYGAGVVRLSLGDNTEMGGSVSGGYVRWNFFTDATVEIDGFTWVRDGRLLLPG